MRKKESRGWLISRDRKQGYDLIYALANSLDGRMKMVDSLQIEWYTKGSFVLVGRLTVLYT